MFTAMSNRLINLHLVSDSTGETLHSIARATLVRFEESQVVSHRWSLIRTRLQLDRVLQGIAAEPGRSSLPLLIAACGMRWKNAASGWA